MATRGQKRFFAPSQKTEKIDFERPWAANLTPMPRGAAFGTLPSRYLTAWVIFGPTFGCSFLHLLQCSIAVK